MIILNLPNRQHAGHGRFFSAVILLFCLSTLLPAQEQVGRAKQQQAREKQQLRLAQRYQRSNQHENAIRILEHLYEKNPRNLQYYQELLESYLNLSMTTEATALVEKQLAFYPDNPRYLIDRAGVLYKTGEREKAIETWERIINEHGDDVGIYTMVAHAMTANRLFHEAAGIYRRAYDRHPDQVHLLKGLADFYRRRLQYRDALANYVEYLRNRPGDLQIIARQVLSIEAEDAQLDTLITLLREESRKSPDIPEIQLLAAKFFQKHENYPDALAIYRELESAEIQGRYLIEFAHAVETDSLFELALSAYRETVERFPDSRHILHAYLGAARCNLALATARNDQQFARKAIEMIHRVQENYPRHGKIAELSLLEGDIYRRFFFDLDRALEIYLMVADRYGNAPEYRDPAFLNAGETYLMRGNPDKADDMFLRISEGDLQAKAQYYRVRIAYYLGNYETAGERLAQLIQQQGFSGEITNDALDLQALLTFAADAPQALAHFAAAEWLIYQQKRPQALSELQNALAAEPPAGLKARIIFEAARQATEIDEVEEALSYCRTILDDPELAVFADEALFIMASIVDHHLQKPLEAFRLYDQLLAGFPNSQFVIPARERLKEIRQENPGLVP